MYVQVMVTTFYYDNIFFLSNFLWHLLHRFQSLTQGHFIKAKLAMLYLTAQGTSVPSEWVFSTDEDIVTT